MMNKEEREKFFQKHKDYIFCDLAYAWATPNVKKLIDKIKLDLEESGRLNKELVEFFRKRYDVELITEDHPEFENLSNIENYCCVAFPI